ncbi:MAG: hypothetical protein NXI23_10460 [Bacteroidetes bacterium]|jgi:hypothetical protein|nr:hypothetical protein [Bacteroidota bacterium]MDF1864120.1 hypothetical protein [Saprospiraceae bacterium]
MKTTHHPLDSIVTTVSELEIFVVYPVDKTNDSKILVASDF